MLRELIVISDGRRDATYRIERYSQDDLEKAFRFINLLYHDAIVKDENIIYYKKNSLFFCCYENLH